MSEFDSIKRFINIMLLLIISCFLIFAFTEFFYMLKTQHYTVEPIFHVFIIYFLIDLSITINDEREMYYPEYYKSLKYRAIRVIRITNIHY